MEELACRRIASCLPTSQLPYSKDVAPDLRATSSMRPSEKWVEERTPHTPIIGAVGVGVAFTTTGVAVGAGGRAGVLVGEAEPPLPEPPDPPLLWCFGVGLGIGSGVSADTVMMGAALIGVGDSPGTIGDGLPWNAVAVANVVSHMRSKAAFSTRSATRQ